MSSPGYRSGEQGSAGDQQGTGRLSRRDRPLPLVSLIALSALLLGWGVLPGLAIAAAATSGRRVDGRTGSGDPQLVPFGAVDATTAPDRFLALALAAGLSTWTLGGAALARLGVLTEGPVVFGGVVLGLVSVFVLAWPVRHGLARALGPRDDRQLLVGVGIDARRRHPGARARMEPW